MYNKSNSENNLILLDIDDRFIQMFGIKNYINPNIQDIKHYDMKKIVDDLTPFGFLILTFHIYMNPIRIRYNLHADLQNKINNLDVEKEIKEIKIDFSGEHNETHNITDVYFNIYDANLKLNENGYEIEPNKVVVENIYYFYDYKFVEDRKASINKILGVEIDDKVKNKYLKYKNKYLKLKELIQKKLV
jgi:hypothetical protein